MKVKIINHVLTLIPSKKDMPTVRKWVKKQKSSEVPFTKLLQLLLACPYDSGKDK
jgi:hypothetical protein